MVGRWMGVVGAVCVSVSVASARPSPVPKAEPPPIRPLRAELGLGFGSARGDYHDVDASPLLRARFGYQVHPNIAVHGVFRYIDVRVDVDWLDVEQSNIDVGAGIRATNPVAPKVRAFSDLEIFHHAERYTINGESESDSGIGYGLRGGAAFLVSPKLELAGFVGYHWTTFESDDEEGTSAWATIEFGAVFLL